MCLRDSYVPLHALCSRTYIVHIQCNTGWYESVIPVAPVSFRSPPSSTNSNRLWTRAKVNTGANTRPPQTPPGSKLVLLLQRSRDKRQCTHKGSKICFLINPLCGQTFGEFYHRHLRTDDHYITERRRRFSPTSVSSLLEVWE